MKASFATLSVLAVWGATTALLPAAETAPEASGTEFFEKQVRPLLVKRCYECHSAAGKVRGDLLLDSKPGWVKGGSSGPAIVPGDPAASLLIDVVQGNNGLQMPPSGKLPESEVAVLVEWVKRGAPDSRSEATSWKKQGLSLEEGRQFWSFQPVRRPATPAVRDETWPHTPVDQFILARQETEGVRPAADADPLTLLRRIRFDLTGLPPSPEEVASFVEECRLSANFENSAPRSAVESLVDRLLATPQFGERWGRHWLDLARYAESVGAENNTLLHEAWRYRDYVIASLNKDKPYDRFLLEQIAGDLLPGADDAQRNEQLVATGFLAMGPYDDARAGEQSLMDRVDEQIDVLGKATLGLTIACARCHDHKFDPVPTTDYYALAGILRSSEIAKTTVYTKGLHTLVRMTFGRPLAGYDQAIVDEFARVQREFIATRKESQAAEAAYKSLVKQESQAGDGDESSRQSEELAAAKRTLDEVFARRARLGAVRIELPPMAMAVVDAAAPEDCRLCVRGDIEDRGPAVPRGFLSVVAGSEPPRISRGTSGRLELARWIVDRDNPLTARVAVNRVWQHLFGVGLVQTVDNFGTTGSRPSHPELLDYLADRFAADGWSVKRLVRDLVLSRTYRLASVGESGAAQDPGNRLLWRMNRRRLEAEPLRDATLAFSGRLDLTPREKSLIHEIGPGAMRYLSDLVTDESDKRSVYLPLPRGKPPEFFAVFDGADQTLAAGDRLATTVAPQALYMLNGPFVMDQSRRAAERLLALPGLDDQGRVNRAFLGAFGRPASAQDQASAQKFFRECERIDAASATEDSTARLDSWAGFCQLLICTAEFRYLN